MQVMQAWREGRHLAHLEEILPDGVVRCHLSPRNCVIKEGHHGFCGVRANHAGRLVSLNYGKSVHITEETIETEAVNHYAPGERILSLGNIGCMLNCIYCHNWKTSQAKYVDDKDVYYYTPEGVVETAIRHGIRVLSWTYNDPVVWHEFVHDTAKLAHEAGLINLYKSAFFISLEAVDELLPYIDIFSISVKSIDPEYYRKYTSGWLQPVLDGIKHVYRAGKHVEVSTLMITDISDNRDTAREVADWVLTELDATVPVHFVRFHPDYKLRNTIRTPVDRLEEARELGMEMGLQHVYLGNVYDTPWTNTYCRGCNALLVTRYGLNARSVGLNAAGRCASCGTDAHVKLLPKREQDGRKTLDSLPADCQSIRSFTWHGDIRSIHVQARNTTDVSKMVCHRRRKEGSAPAMWNALELAPGESFRFIIAKSSTDETGADIALAEGITSNLHEVFDRAHFPTIAIEEAAADTDISPLPIFPGRQLGKVMQASGAAASD